MKYYDIIWKRWRSAAIAFAGQQCGVAAAVVQLCCAGGAGIFFIFQFDQRNNKTRMQTAKSQNAIAEQNSI